MRLGIGSYRLAAGGWDPAEFAGRDPATLALTAVTFLVPPGAAQAVEVPGQLLGGPRASAASVTEELGLLARAGVSACSLWLPIASPAIPDAMSWVADEILTAGVSW